MRAKDGGSVPPFDAASLLALRRVLVLTEGRDRERNERIGLVPAAAHTRSLFGDASIRALIKENPMALLASWLGALGAP